MSNNLVGLSHYLPKWEKGMADCFSSLATYLFLFKGEIKFTLRHLVVCVFNLCILVVVYNIYNAFKQNSTKSANKAQLCDLGSVCVNFFQVHLHFGRVIWWVKALGLNQKVSGSIPIKLWADFMDSSSSEVFLSVTAKMAKSQLLDSQIADNI